MQCIWQNLARTPSSGSGSFTDIFSNARHSVARISRHNALLRPIFNRNTFRKFNTATSPLPSRPPQLSFFQSTGLSVTPERAQGIPPSRLALSATTAVHAALKNQVLEDAFFIVNSIRYAALSERQQQHTSWDTVRNSRVNFPPEISPRLPTHALLHGLVRLGLPQQASQLATSIMKSGVRVRGKTLEKIVEGLTNPPITKSPMRDAQFKHKTESLLGTPSILSLKSSMTSDPNTTFALHLLRAAKKSRSQRTGAMFNMLITLCLVNGEIILASLIFGLLVKEWERRSKVLTQMTLPQSPGERETTSPRAELDAVYRHDLLTKNLQPTPDMLKAIMAPIHDRLSQATSDDLDTPEFQEALQSLANLAALVDNRQLPFPQLSSVIRTLSRCPRVENGVWVGVPEQPNFIPAYHYFQGVLQRLAKKLPSKQPTKRSIVYKNAKGLVSVKFKLPNPVHHMQPPLDLPSYNTLIHYALRNRFSPALAKKVYQHMTLSRNPPLPANSATTSNILFRSVALYQREDMATKMLEVLRPLTPRDTWKKAFASEPKRVQLPGNFRYSKRSELVSPAVPTPEMLIKDNYTLSTFLSSLISCGRSHLAIHLMQRLLPIVPYHRRSVSSEVANADRQQKWDESLSRAVVFGPHVLGSFLHALITYGATRKSHMLFKLIIQASKKSRDPQFIDNPKPWNVSIPIYTMMLRAYKAEVERFRRRRGIRLQNYLLGKAAILYKMAKQDVRQNIVGMNFDSRFFNALLKIFAQCLSVREASIWRAKKHLALSRQRHAETGFVDDQGYTSFFEEVITDMEALGYSIPVGFQHLFIGKRNTNFADVGDFPELPRVPYAFATPRLIGGPYTLPVHWQKSLPSVRHPRPRRARRSHRTRFNR